MQPALYRAERPEIFEEIIGQKHIVRILQNQIRNGTVSQAYLFAGTHGTGKTSTARILAKAVNCTGKIDGGRTAPCGHCENCEAIREGRFPDCIELDAASNNGVDDLRTIIDMVKYPPSTGRYKVYIIDEVHMLSTAAENAFLKTLEEPPEHAIFILATTDPQKVRSTIRSRCMQLNFKRVSENELVSGMEGICSRRNITATKEALAAIASRADGSVRDALSILEQCAAAGDGSFDRNDVLEYTGAAGEDFFIALTGSVIAHDAGMALTYIDEVVKEGKDAGQLLKDWLKYLRDLMIVKYTGNRGRILNLSNENISRLKQQAGGADASFIENAVRLISEYINIGRYSERPRILLETAAVKLALPEGTEPAAVKESGASQQAPFRSTCSVAAAGMRTNMSKTSSPQNAGSAAPEATLPVQLDHPDGPEGIEPIPGKSVRTDTPAKVTSDGSIETVGNESRETAGPARSEPPAGTGDPGRPKEYASTAEKGRSKEYASAAETGRSKEYAGAAETENSKEHAGAAETENSKEHTGTGDPGRPVSFAEGLSEPGVEHAADAESAAGAGRPSPAPATGSQTSQQSLQPESRPNSEPASPDDSATSGKPGNPDEMWERIVSEISADNRSFRSLVGRNSSGESFDGTELSVAVSPGKIRLAENMSEEITRVARNLYGSGIFIKFTSGDSARAPVSPDAAAAGGNVKEVEELFGVTPVIEN